MSIARRIYVISDLHLGGEYPRDRADPTDRGFRMCTRADAIAEFVRAVVARAGETPIELVINGDAVDFLAEELPVAEKWLPFIDDADLAADRIDVIMARDRPVFDALAELLEAGHRLTLLLGNHDVELSFPRVRARIERALRVTGRSDFNFIYDGEAYTVGDVLIEHGNRYDGFNVVDYDGLRRVRSAQTRGETVPSSLRFRIPTGSKIVAEVMNAIKVRFPFVDLLKPEDTVCVPILLALAPECRGQLGRIARYSLQAKLRARDEGPLKFGGDISAASSTDALGGGMDFGGDMGGAADMGGAVDAGGDDDALAELLGGHMGDEARPFLDELAEASPPGAEGVHTAGDISSGLVDRALSVGRLLLSSSMLPLHQRARPLLGALRAARYDRSFDRGVETDAAYFDAARALVGAGHKVVVFGHTHKAKRVTVGDSVYLNTGTWADLMQFPAAILDGGDALEKLVGFCQQLDERRFSDHVRFTPTFARIDVDDGGRAVAAELRDYTGPDSI